MSRNELDLVQLLKDRSKKQNRKGKNKGCFGKNNHAGGNYTSLKVVPKTQRTEKNCNKHGVANNA